VLVEKEHIWPQAGQEALEYMFHSIPGEIRVETSKNRSSREVPHRFAPCATNTTYLGEMRYALRDDLAQDATPSR